MTTYWDYESIIMGAEQGDPHCMLELAKLNKAGAFGSMNIDEYVYWLERFFEVPIIQQIVANLEDNYSNDDSSYRTDSLNFQDNTVLPEGAPFVEEDMSRYIYEFLLRDDIIEAGMALGIYYKNSSKKEELELSIRSLQAALDASAGDYLVYAHESISSILIDIAKRMIKLGYWSGEENE